MKRTGAAWFSGRPRFFYSRCLLALLLWRQHFLGGGHNLASGGLGQRLILGKRQAALDFVPVVNKHDDLILLVEFLLVDAVGRQGRLAQVNESQLHFLEFQVLGQAFRRAHGRAAGRIVADRLFQRRENSKRAKMRRLVVGRQGFQLLQQYRERLGRLFRRLRGDDRDGGVQLTIDHHVVNILGPRAGDGKSGQRGRNQLAFLPGGCGGTAFLRLRGRRKRQGREEDAEKRHEILSESGLNRYPF